MWVVQLQRSPAAELRLQVGEGLAEPAQIQHRGPHDDVNVVCAAEVPVRLNRDSTYDHELDAVFGERQQDLVGREDAVRRRVHAWRVPWRPPAPSQTRNG